MPSTIDTTIRLKPHLHRQVEEASRAMGLGAVSDLVETVLRDFLASRDLRAKHALMSQAAQDEGYRRELLKVGHDFASADSEGLGDDY